MTEPVVSRRDRVLIALRLKYPPLGQGPSLEQRRADQRRMGPTLVVVFGATTLLGSLETAAGVVLRSPGLVVAGVVVAGGSYYACRRWRSIVRRLKALEP